MNPMAMAMSGSHACICPLESRSQHAALLSPRCVFICAQLVLLLLGRRRLRTVHNACTGALHMRFRRLGPAAVPSAAATA